MSGDLDRQALGVQFDDVAEAYDRLRPAYPDGLIDAACDAAGLRSGDHVLEVGCGAGQLTTALISRGLRVVAVEPGEQMIQRARGRVGGDAVRFLHGRFEDVPKDGETFAAVFSATAFHWVDPAVSWARAASVLTPGGSLVLLTHCSGADAESIEIERALMASLRAVAPESATAIPAPRTASEVLDGVAARQGNVSELWSWIGPYTVHASEAATLFDDTRLLTDRVVFEWSADTMNAHRRTTSLTFRLTADELASLEADTQRIIAGYGGRIRLPALVLAAVARRI